MKPRAPAHLLVLVRTEQVSRQTTGASPAAKTPSSRSYCDVIDHNFTYPAISVPEIYFFEHHHKPSHCRGTSAGIPYELTSSMDCPSPAKVHIRG
jgi:hypothetical protein